MKRQTENSQYPDAQNGFLDLFLDLLNQINDTNTDEYPIFRRATEPWNTDIPHYPTEPYPYDDDHMDNYYDHDDHDWVHILKITGIVLLTVAVIVTIIVVSACTSCCGACDGPKRPLMIVQPTPTIHQHLTHYPVTREEAALSTGTLSTAVSPSPAPMGVMQGGELVPGPARYHSPRPSQVGMPLPMESNTNHINRQFLSPVPSQAQSPIAWQ